MPNLTFFVPHNQPVPVATAAVARQLRRRYPGIDLQESNGQVDFLGVTTAGGGSLSGGQVKLTSSQATMQAFDAPANYTDEGRRVLASALWTPAFVEAAYAARTLSQADYSMARSLGILTTGGLLTGGLKNIGSSVGEAVGNAIQKPLDSTGKGLGSLAWGAGAVLVVLLIANHALDGALKRAILGGR